MQRLFALVDCNNVYASCERVFDPSLWNRPVIVLSNKDSCVIARSNEAQALGIKMGQPFFTLGHLIITKKNRQYSGVFDIADHPDVDELLDRLEVVTCREYRNTPSS